jgi:hypothetical protein
MDNIERKANLLRAQKNAEQLFLNAEHRGLIAAGKNEKRLIQKCMNSLTTLSVFASAGTNELCAPEKYTPPV